jgi:hypothetical protein
MSQADKEKDKKQKMECRGWNGACGENPNQTKKQKLKARRSSSYHLPFLSGLTKDENRGISK